MSMARALRRAKLPLLILVLAASTSLIGLSFAGGDSTTQTTIPVPLPSGAIQTNTTIPIPTGAPDEMTHLNAPTVAEASVACTPSDLTAVLAGVGPYAANIQTGQYIVSIESDTPCTLDGYPSVVTIVSTSDSNEVTSMSDSGVVGDVPGAGTVTASATTPVSFLFQFNNGLSCPNDSSISFELPGSDTAISVNVNALVNVCGAIQLTPFVQGNSAERYF
jgi:hypothetical protein